MRNTTTERKDRLGSGAELGTAGPKTGATSHRLRRLAAERGLTTVEYVIILALIAIVCIAAWSRFGRQVKENVHDRGTGALNTLPQGS